MTLNTAGRDLQDVEPGLFAWRPSIQYGAHRCRVPKAKHRDCIMLLGAQIALICGHARENHDVRLAAPNGGSGRVS
jgi:hypothetical protein